MSSGMDTTTRIGRNRRQLLPLLAIGGVIVCSAAALAGVALAGARHAGPADRNAGAQGAPGAGATAGTSAAAGAAQALSTAHPSGGAAPGGQVAAKSGHAAPSPSAAPLVACSAAALAASVTTDNTSYALGKTVLATSRVVNRGATTCTFPDDAVQVINDQNATIFWCWFSHEQHFTNFSGGLEPGRSLTDTCSWQQQDLRTASRAQVPPGTYRFLVTWRSSGGQPVEASTSVTVQAAAPAPANP